MSKSDLIDLEMILVHRTDRAVLLRLLDEDKEVWLPFSRIEIDPSDADATDKVTVTLPEWLAIDKELVYIRRAAAIFGINCTNDFYITHHKNPTWIYDGQRHTKWLLLIYILAEIYFSCCFVPLFNGITARRRCR